MSVQSDADIVEGPRPIDPRAPRFNQAVLCTGLLLAFLLDVPVVAPLLALALAVGVVLGPQYGPFLQVYARFIRPRLDPPRELEDPRPPRFAATVGVLFLTGSTVAFLADAAPVGWVLALIVAALAGLAAASGICVGCELYLVVARRRGFRPVA